MRHRIRSHLTYANVVATLALFLVLGGGTALASYVVSSNSQIGPGTISGHKPPTGKHANIIAGSINGTDIADRSGVDTCQMPLLAKFGPICAGSDGGARTFHAAMDYCAGFGLRLASSSEAVALATKYDVPGVSGIDAFWADDENYISGDNVAAVVAEDGTFFYRNIGGAATAQTVCVTDPSA
jgi:hypothetical protein